MHNWQSGGFVYHIILCVNWPAVGYCVKTKVPISTSLSKFLELEGIKLISWFCVIISVWHLLTLFHKHIKRGSGSDSLIEWIRFVQIQSLQYSKLQITVLICMRDFLQHKYANKYISRKILFTKQLNTTLISIQW